MSSAQLLARAPVLDFHFVDLYARDLIKLAYSLEDTEADDTEVTGGRTVAWAANKSFEALKVEFKFPRARTVELFRARSRLYRSHILQVNTRWKALAEIYTMHSFAPISNLKIFVKNC